MKLLDWQTHLIVRKKALVIICKSAHTNLKKYIQIARDRQKYKYVNHYKSDSITFFSC